MFVRIEQSEAEKLALVLDSVEADLVGLQHRVFRVRDKLQQKAGKPCGFQYTGPNERGGENDAVAALKLLLADGGPLSDPISRKAAVERARAAVAKAEGRTVTP